jgi:hypothetical protein
MINVELFSLTAKYKDRPVACRWAYHREKPRKVFHIKRANHSGNVIPVTKFEVVKMVARPGWDSPVKQTTVFGVVTCITNISKYNWRTDYRVSIKCFDNILDAIDYSETKRAKYQNNKKV